MKKTLCVLLLLTSLASARDHLIVRDLMNNPASPQSRVLVLNSTLDTEAHYESPAFKFSASMGLDKNCLWISYNYFNDVSNTDNEAEETRQKLYNTVSCLNRKTKKEMFYKINAVPQVGHVATNAKHVVFGGAANPVLFSIQNGKVVKKQIFSEGDTLMLSGSRHVVFSNTYAATFFNNQLPYLHLIALPSLKVKQKLSLFPGRYEVVYLNHDQQGIQVLAWYQEKLYHLTIRGQQIQKQVLPIDFSKANFMEPSFRLEENTLMAYSAVSSQVIVYNMLTQKQKNLTLCQGDGFQAEMFSGKVVMLCQDNAGFLEVYDLKKGTHTRKKVGTQLDLLALGRD